MSFDRVAAATGDPLECCFERGVLEWLDLSAVAADEVVMMLSAGECRLEARDAVAEVDPLYEPAPIQAFQGAIDACNSHARTLAAEAVVDLLCRQATVLPAQELDDFPARRSAASARCSEPLERALGPGVRHVDNDTRSQRRARVTLAMWKLSARVTALLIALVASGALAACGGADENGAPADTIVAAFYPLAWAAEQVVGEGSRVENLTPPGAEPHDVELSPRDVEAVHDADLVLYLGSGFQPALEQALETRSGPSLDLLEGQELMKGLDEEGQEAARDPHVWLDPARFAEMVTGIGRELGREDPAAELASRLRALDRKMAGGLETCERREIVTSHTAFGYLARRYDLVQIGLTGISPEAEPSPGGLVELVDEVEESGATTVFFETLVSPRLAQTVAREAGAETAVLNPLEGLSDAELGAGEDYVSVMRANLAALREALGCR